MNQSDEIASDLRFAVEAENVETPNGVLQPQAGMTEMEGQFTGSVKSIARFYRRWYDDKGSKEWLVCASGGNLYYRQADDSPGWQKINMPSEFSFQSDDWSWVTYEQNVEGVDHPVDVLLMSNNKDGIYMIVPPDRPTTWGDLYRSPSQTGFKWKDLYKPETTAQMTWLDVYSYKWQATKVNVIFEDEDTGVTKEYRFGAIERFKERLWAADIVCVETTPVEDDDPIVKTYAEPDKLMYSAVYDPTDWRQYPYYDPDDEECDPADPTTWKGQSEDGSGEINQPTWDGDRFSALKSFGDQLIAFKGTRVWRVMGTTPDDFEIVEQYGGGTLYPNTIAVEKDRILLVERDGISVYDGMTVSPFNRPLIEKFWRTVNVNAMDQMCAAMFKQRYYLAVPTGNSEVNNELIVFNEEEGTFLHYTDMYIESLMPAGDILYATSSNTPGKVFEIHYNSWETSLTSGKKAKWETPWMDFNYKSIAKGGYEIYFNPEVKKYPVTFRFSIKTEKKTKSKTVIIQPTMIQTKQKRIRFGGTSRRFKLIIEVLPVPTGAVWRLTGGIHMVVETDPD